MSEANEVKILAKLVFEGKEVETVEKCFGFVEDETEGNEEHVKTLDEIVLEFLQELENKAREAGYSIPENSLSQIVVSVIFFLIKHPEPELELNIEVEKIGGSDAEASA